MYLISVYFDEQTDKKIRSFMEQIGKRTDNTAMQDGNVPPHITLSAFSASSEEHAKKIFKKITEDFLPGKVYLVSIGTFLPHVIYLSVVLNEYLHNLSVIISKEVIAEGALSDGRYQPFSWLPHVTLGKKTE